MADRYLQFSRTAPGRFLARRLGLPQPAELHRWSAERPALEGPLLHLTAGVSRLGGSAGSAGSVGSAGSLGEVLARTGLEVRAAADRPAAVVLDATGVADVEALAEVHAALHPVVRSVADSGRVVVLGAPLDPADHHQAAVQQGLEGFVRSLGKEMGRGRTVSLVRIASDAGAGGGAAAAAAESTLRFLLSPKSAFVSGQVIEVGGGEVSAPEDSERPEDWGRPEDWERPLAGRTALVTGAARGIGEAVAETLARDGARVVCLDVPAAQSDLVKVADRLGGSALPLDITADDAGERIAAALPDGLDVLVHNAGITRDRKLANMPAEQWSSVLDVNLASVLRTTDSLLKAGTLRTGGRIVATASIAGLAGNVGQTNYAASKAGIVGLVRALAPRAAAEHGVTVNAVAPGFIETRMTAAVPLFIREAGRRMNSLAQGGLPVDVAETTAWFANPGSGGVNGQVVRVCGQSLLGA
ncbi:3-oxoacyl-ACP reductase [Streptomyces jeddahensis]|uniref:3-oxoacyl-[acyl-carrier-protein] reductase FabG n=1 Tax=Streptomyces jeddahensis TaxID=1716141 RepID=A0A177HL38_9ACTN|nr:3-oxoacyl-ACP reductase [Streptomyces jeddahensis]OAH11623.1 3-oxoacyl-[acyl-carrier-protein] reductase FabG [Streptomyces jeddahensis]